MNIPSLATILADHVSEHGDGTFLLHERSGFELAYGAIPRFAREIDAWLDGQDVSSPSPVAALLDNHWAVFALLFACADRRGPLVPLSPELHPDALKALVKQSGARALLHEGPVDEDSIPRRVSLATPEQVFSETRTQDSVELAEDRTEASDEPLLVIFTSGTTSRAKGVVLTEQNLVLNAQGIREMYEIGPEDRFLCVLPTYHINALLITGLVPFLAGAEVVLSRRFKFDVAKFYLDKVEQHEPSILSVTPSIMAVMTRIFPETDLGAAGVRFALCGTAPLPDDQWKRFEDHFSIPVYQGYGLTETTCWATMNEPEPSPRHGTVGVPVNCEIRIDDPDDEGVGEVLVGGPILMKEYAGAKAGYDEDGFLRTGDLGFVDEEGRLVISGRIKDIIIRNGININPEEIDEALRGHPDVAHAATVGVPDGVSGEAVYSAWIPTSDVTTTSLQLRKWLSERISSFLIPDRIVRVGKFPRTGTGKVVKKELIRRLTRELADEIVAAVNTRKWVRYKLDDDVEVRDAVQRAIVEGRPLRFLKYWGFGERAEANGADEAALDRLRELLNLVDEVWEEGTELTLLFTDMHYRVNEKDSQMADHYMGEVGDLARARGFRTAVSSELWREAGLALPQVREASNSRGVRARFDALECRDQLIDQARRHGDSESAEELARFYFHVNEVEGELYEERFPDHVFLTYNRGSQGVLLPNLPKIFVHSYKRNVSEKPWFTSVETAGAGSRSTS